MRSIFFTYLMPEPKDMPIMIEVIVFRKHNDAYEFLCLKRTVADGGWWQPVIGHMHMQESIMQAMYREVLEETGITDPIRVIEDVWHFHWEHKEQMHLEFVFGMEVTENQKIILNPPEHETYTWKSADDAISLYKYENNKEALRKVLVNYLQ